MKLIAIAAAFLALTFALDARAADTKPPPKGKAKATPAQIQAVKTAKAGFMAAMGSCPRPENCDPASKDKNPELVTDAAERRGSVHGSVRAVRDRCSLRRGADEDQGGQGTVRFQRLRPASARQAGHRTRRGQEERGTLQMKAGPGNPALQRLAREGTEKAVQGQLCPRRDPV